MAPEAEQLSPLSNPLATVDQLSTSSSQLDGVPADLESSLRFAGAQLTQAAGILLRLPQEIIAQAIVIFQRFYVGSEGGSFRINAVKDVSAASLYMTAKMSFEPQSPRSVLNVYAYLLSPISPLRLTPQGTTEKDQEQPKPDPKSYTLPEPTYHTARTTLLQTESILLRSLSFSTHVLLPHHLALTYLQTLAALPATPTPASTALASRTLAHLNTALFSPQLLYLTHQPPALAVAAIYLAAREVGVRLAGVEWWEVFDVDRETLGFLVVGLGSCEGWVRRERVRWRGRRCPLDLEELEREIGRGDEGVGKGDGGNG
ncbi:cyclin domain-containing protein [Usnea florida]